MSFKEIHKDISHDIIGAAFDVRKYAGKGFREKYYQSALVYELQQRGRKVETEVQIPVIYKGIEIDSSYYADIIVEGVVLIELKALTTMAEEECRQILSYMKLSGFELGFLINFGAKDFKLGNTWEDLPYRHGIYRFINDK